MKKLLSILLALVMILSLATTAFAADDNPGGEGGTSGETATPNKGDNNNNGTLTINNTIAGIEYKIWQIFVLESYDEQANAYSYTVAPGWEGFVDLYDYSIDVDKNGYVTHFDVARAADAVQYAEDHNIEPTKTTTSEGTSVVFTDLNLGYYVVDSSVGSVCALTTTDPDAVINEKNTAHSVDKQVKEYTNNSDENGTWADSNTAYTGKPVEFKSTITISGPARDLVLHDYMDDGLTFGSVSKVTLIEIDDETKTEKTVDVANYTVTPNAEHIVPGENEGETTTETHTFDVVFTKNFTDSLSHQDQIIVYYTATLNDNAVVREAEYNRTYLSYTNSSDDTSKSSEDYTTTTTSGHGVRKIAGVPENGKPLAGATFALYTQETEKEDGTFEYSGEIKLKLKEGETNVYRVDPNGAVTEITTGETGHFIIEGLDYGTYYLKEVNAPEGYNLLKEAVEIYATNTDASVTVVNNPGTELPETGGMGTTLIYTLGAILAVGSLILLVVKKRMAAAE